MVFQNYLFYFVDLLSSDILHFQVLQHSNSWSSKSNFLLSLFLTLTESVFYLSGDIEQTSFQGSSAFKLVVIYFVYDLQ